MVEVKAAGLVIFRKLVQIEYLLLQASYEPHHWTPPKGHVEVGESDMETALRETEEEAGLKRDQLKIHEEFKKSLHYKAHGKSKESVYWLAEVKDPEVKVTLSFEHQEFSWAPLKKSQELSKYPEMQSLLAECEAFLKRQ